MGRTIVCPACQTQIVLEPQPPQPQTCEQCGASNQTLYTVTAGRKTLTLCLRCFQSASWAQTKAGPSETKRGEQ